MNNITAAMLCALAGAVSAAGANLLISARLYGGAALWRGGWLEKSLYGVMPLAFFCIGLIQWNAFYLFGYCYSFILLLFLAAASVLDIRTKTVPNWLSLAALVVWVLLTGTVFLLNPVQGIYLLLSALAGLAFSGGVFLLVYLISRQKLGGADVKIAALMGLYLTGTRIVGAVFYGVLFCAIYSLGMLAMKKIGKKDGVPMLPFLTAGTMFTLLIVV